jgi:hypothetical protein
VHDLWFREFALAYTNIAMIIEDGYRDAEDNDGVFSSRGLVRSHQWATRRAGRKLTCKARQLGRDTRQAGQPARSACSRCRFTHMARQFPGSHRQPPERRG